VPLSESERATISRRVADAEARTGAQIVAAVVERSDSYPELPWKAFALAASGGALVAVLAILRRPALDAVHGALLVALAALGAGAVLALAAAFLPPVTRALLDAQRAEGEVRQHAQGLFLRHQLFATKRRVGVLLLASRLERRVVVLADVGVEARTGPRELRSVVDAMTPALRGGRTADAFAAGLDALEALLAERGLAGPAPDELPDELVEEEGG
jgi:putative membrane protein